MQPITSYDTLIAAVTSLAEDVGTELQEYLPVAVDNAENRLAREIDFLGMDYISSAIPVAPNATMVSKPTGHKLTYFLKCRVPATGEIYVLDKKQDDYLVEYAGMVTSATKPKYYSDTDEASFRIAPSPTQAVEITVHGMRRPTPYLSTSNQTNALTRLVPDALLYATMLEISIWQRNSVLRSEYEPLYVACRDSINNEGRRQRRDNGSPVGNPEPGRNTLLGSQTNQ